MHLEHRIPWNALDKALAIEQHPKDPEKLRLLVNEAGLSVVGHFARCLQDAIKEFEATDKSTLEDREKYDIHKWKNAFGYEIHLSGAGGYLGSLKSVVAGYVELNLLLLNWPKYWKFFTKSGFRDRDWVLDVCCGYCDGGHPKWLAERLDALWRNGPPQHITEVVQVIQQHCKDLFRCLYTSGSDLFTAFRIEATIHWCFGLWRLHLFNEEREYSEEVRKD